MLSTEFDVASPTTLALAATPERNPLKLSSNTTQSVIDTPNWRAA